MTKQPASPADLGALSNLAPELAHAFASVAADIALVVDVSGVIRNVSVGGTSPLPARAEQWIGRRWEETVSDETRGKIELLLQEAVESGVSRRREVNLPLDGTDVPVAYAAIRLGAYGPVLAVGRDLRAVAAIQQRFADTQQQMEREYWKKRQSESRYRMLFQVATDAVLMIDAQTYQIGEANRAAAELFDLPPESLVGRPVTAVIDHATRPGLQALLAQARESGRPAEVKARLARGGRLVSVSAAPFRSDGDLHLLVRARAAEAVGPSPPNATPLADLVARIPDGVVITDAAGRIRMANPAFAALCGMADEEQALGSPLARWLGQAEGDLMAILAGVRGQGIAPRTRTVLRPVGQPPLDVEISAALLEDAEQENVGITIRRVAEPSPAVAPLLDELSRAVEQLSLQIGEEPLPTLLRQVTELAERHFIAASVVRAGGDLDEASTLLGVSRRSLELRLHRHGFLSDDRDDPPPAEDRG